MNKTAMFLVMFYYYKRECCVEVRVAIMSKLGNTFSVTKDVI